MATRKSGMIRNTLFSKNKNYKDDLLTDKEINRMSESLMQKEEKEMIDTKEMDM